VSDGIRFEYTDVNGRPHERRWQFIGDTEGGVLVVGLDDHGVEFDRVKLKREGAFIVHELRATTRIPEAFDFLRPLVELRERAVLMGFDGNWPAVLVHSEHMRRAFDLGYTPGIERPPARGKAEFFGIRIVWDETLDNMAL
jgi:hypothetical protein